MSTIRCACASYAEFCLFCSIITIFSYFFDNYIKKSYWYLILTRNVLIFSNSLINKTICYSKYKIRDEVYLKRALLWSSNFLYQLIQGDSTYVLMEWIKIVRIGMKSPVTVLRSLSKLVMLVASEKEITIFQRICLLLLMRIFADLTGFSRGHELLVTIYPV